MTKKPKTPRIGTPPEGFIRIVMDYPIDQPTNIECRTERPEFPPEWEIPHDSALAERWWRIVSLATPRERAAEGKLRCLVRSKQQAEPFPQTGSVV